MKSGFASFIGRPNVGKSTLLNSILNKKVVITSNKPQTTRNLVQGIYNEDDTQIIFVDTPGIHKAHNKLGRALNKQAYFTINDVDIIIMVVDITEKVGSGDKFVIDILKNVENKPVFLVINKIDKLPREEILSKIEEYMSLYNFTEVIPVSARKKDNVDRLIEVIKKYLPDNIKYFDSDTVTNSSPEFIISELIREKVLELTDEEVPHSVTCIVDELYEEEKIINIGASIIVDRENLKKIIIGKNGNMIKEIGIRARKDIEEYFGKQVYLDLFVKVIPKWRDKEKFLNMIGYKDFLNK
ncbi:MAG: GTPase Era [Clostridium sp.]|nr:GTPase Era [Clostridium sp.]